MKINKQIIILSLCFVILFLILTLPLWWDDISPMMIELPGFIIREINAYIGAVEWLIDEIFKECISDQRSVFKYLSESDQSDFSQIYLVQVCHSRISYPVHPGLHGN